MNYFQLGAFCLFGGLLYFAIIAWIGDRDVRKLEEELNREDHHDSEGS